MGKVDLGLIASLGGFTAMYGMGRAGVGPLLDALVASALVTLSVAVGHAGSGHAWLAVAIVGAWSAAATILSSCLNLGLPGIAVLVLVCAIASDLPAAHEGRDVALSFITAKAAVGTVAIPLATRAGSSWRPEQR
jgi:hypothetical protein